jgi:virginiamycin B lyase
MKNRRVLAVAGILLTSVLVSLVVTSAIQRAGAADAPSLAGMATIAGAVDAPKPFKAAQVHLMNAEKNVLFMVYTSGGRYRAVNLFPGRYEITVRKPGFAADTKTVVVAANATETVNFSLREQAAQPIRQGEFGFTTQRAGEVKLLSYDELYPKGPGRVVLEKACLYCHGNNFFPIKQLPEPQWNHFIDYMLGKDNERGAMVPAGTLTEKDRAALLAYLVQNFGPQSEKRGLKSDADFPLDEAALGKAMYVEYYLPLDPKLDAGNKQRRTQEPHFDPSGNVWYTDRSVPNRIGRVDPRTGEFKDFMMPDPTADPHGLTVDTKGHVFWAETRGFHLGRLDPATGSMMRYPMDATGQKKGAGHTPVVDSKDNVWFTVIRGDMLGKWDRATGKSTVWKVPTVGAAPYGIALDRAENVWFAEFRRCKIGKFDPKTEKFTEYDALTQPCTIRRLGVDSKDVVWYGGFSSGKLGKMDPATGKIVEYAIPMPFSEPYDVWPDRHDDIWISDGGQGGALIKFDQRTEKFTYYPAPQITDQPKLAITREGAIWYTPRSSSKAAVGVLYPDVTRITTLAARY